jgi:hypothetical protein
VAQLAKETTLAFILAYGKCVVLIFVAVFVSLFFEAFVAQTYVISHFLDG